MIQTVNFIFWLLVIPFCIGLVPASVMPENKRDPITVFIAGYLLMWSVFEVIAIPAVILIKYDNFTFVLRYFTAAAILLAAAGILLRYYDYRKSGGETWLGIANLRDAVFSAEAKAEWLIFAVLLGFQLYMAVTRASFDGDDAYYVVQSLMAQQSNAMYKNLPYTGWSSSLDVRHALAVFPMWVAFVAVNAGVHATVVSHVVMPLALIPLSYFVYYETAKALFGENKENAAVFMIMMALFQIFGNVSIYTNETFFLTRTWQGKAVTASFVIPLCFLLILWLYNEEKENKGRKAGLWIMFVCMNMTAGVCSSLAVFLMTILTGAAAFCIMAVKREFKLPVKLVLCCIPNAIYVLLYLGLAG